MKALQVQAKAYRPSNVLPFAPRLGKVLPKQPQRMPVLRAMPPPSADAILSGGMIDLAQPVLELIGRSASNAAGSIDSHILGHATHAFGITDGAWTSAIGQLNEQHMSVIDGLNNLQAVSSEAIIADGGASAATYVSSAHHMPELSTLGNWASEKLAVVQAIDPAAYDSLNTSLASLLNGLQAAMVEPAAAAGSQYLPWTNALVLGVQQLVTSLRAPAGGVGVETMLAAQEAMQATLATAAAEASGLARAAGLVTGSGAAVGEIPAGLKGLIELVLALIAMIIASVPRNDWKQQMAVNSSDPPLPIRYDVPALQAYFSRRPMMVIRRNTEVISKITSFCLAILADWRLGLWDANIKDRAVSARQIVEELGPTYIKIAQAVATRVDVMPEAYVNELARLQDNVRTFSTEEARKVLEDGLGCRVDEVFDWLSEEPIAAASLGQVYKGMLRPEYGGKEVAVKVQRPGSLESAALDIFVMRRASVLFSKLPGMSDKWAGALDDWALRFFQEMDYELEAKNTMAFKQHMSGLDGVKVATVFPQLTSRKVIVTEWIEGQRLAESSAEDVRALCSTLLNCYLIQLLETGLLHADPHPGNLMRTPDGKIVVLDFGLMTEVTEDQRVALVEYIAHLTMEDWEGVAKDLVRLGFMPEGIPPEVIPQLAPIMEKVMGQLVRGGGLKNGFSITMVATELSGVAMNYKLCIPPYFALVLRAFSVIEGIALKVDPKYAIVQECMPYMSRRLLTDNNPRMRAALRQLLYGNGNRLDMERLTRMMSSFTSFTTAGAQAPTPRLAAGPTFSAAAHGGIQEYEQDGFLGALLSGPDDGPIITEPVKEVLKVVFSKDGSYAQEILVDEAVAAVDAMSREAMGEALRLVSSSAATLAALRGMEALGPLRTMLLPLPLPTEMLSGLQPTVALSREDRQTLSTIRTVLDLLVPPPGAARPNIAGMSRKAARVAGEMAPLLPELLPGMQVTLELFVRQLVRRMALRLADDLTPQAKIAHTYISRPEYQQQQQLPQPPTHHHNQHNHARKRHKGF